MMSFHWLAELKDRLCEGKNSRRLKTRQLQRAVARQQGQLGQRRVASHKHAAETLEDRVLLSTITVTSLADTVAGDDLVTLREAIQAAKIAAGENRGQPSFEWTSDF